MEGVARGEFKTARPSEAARLALTVLEGALLLSRTHQRPRQVSPAGLALVTLLEGRDSEFRSTSEKSE